jgi:DNA-directed RNA polymerase subunit RPC12/RpoP
MSEADSVYGLACPNCGGMVPIPEGQAIVRCPYCELRSLVRGERGLRRYQVPLRVDQARSEATLAQFLKSSRAIAEGAENTARLEEAFLAYLPFWVNWARVLGWVLGEEKVGSGDDARYEPREVKVAEDMTWNGAACDVGEFGVDRLPLKDQSFEPFDSEALHSAGMVFEPIGSLSEAQRSSQDEFHERVQKMANLDRVSQTFVRFVHNRMGLVYYPLWVIRYLYRERAFQIVIDGFTGKVLYGKAPGSTIYRAAVLVGGMILGALLAVDVSALLLIGFGASGGDDSEGLLLGALAVLVAGIGMMIAAYRKYRYGEQYEFRGYRQKSGRFKRRKEGGVYRVQEVC